MIALRRLSFAFGALLACASTPAADQKLPPADADNGGLRLPSGFRALVVADDIGQGRFLAIAENGDIYCKMFRRGAGILALRDTDGDGKADVREVIPDTKAAGTHDSNGEPRRGFHSSAVAIHNGYLYYSSDVAVLRYKLTPGELVPKGEPEVIVKDLANDPNGGGQHQAKAFAFGSDGYMYVEVGSPSNALGNPDRQAGAVGSSPEVVAEFLSKYGGIWRFDPDKLNQTQDDGFHFTTGHRHIVALAWNPTSKALFGTMQGRDLLNVIAGTYYTANDNAEGVSEEMHLLREGVNLGWPYTYYDPRKKQRMLAPEYGGDGKKTAEPGKYDEPVVAFPAHWAPIQMNFYTGTQFPAKYRGGAFVAFHGSWNRTPEPQRGYNITFAPFDEKGMARGTYEVFADGFAGKSEILHPREAAHRPAGVAMGPDGSLYVSSDKVTDGKGGRIWRIFYAGE